MLMQIDISMTSHIPIKGGPKYLNYEQITKNERKLLRNNIIQLMLKGDAIDVHNGYGPKGKHIHK
jgi:hypothetical protein